MDLARLTDDELLARTPGRPEAFGAFYARHERAVVVEPGEAHAVAVFQDGVANATLTMVNGDQVRRPVRDNALLLSSAVAVSWDDPSGRHHAESLVTPARCPSFEPLPPDAVPQAMRAAMDAQPRLYPETTEPRVVSVKRLGRRDRGGDLYRGAARTPPAGRCWSGSR